MITQTTPHGASEHLPTGAQARDQRSLLVKLADEIDRIVDATMPGAAGPNSSDQAATT